MALNVDEWLIQNKTYFQPPVCNRMMHNDQLKVFYVGGPNTRLDYHIEEGEELFYMHRGQMVLKVVTNNKLQNVIIKQGEIFLLPARIPHSPQRQENTIGLVIERERTSNEQDCVRYFVENSTAPLYEHWFHCTDLGNQLVPIIKNFFSSEQYKTGKPIAESLNNSPPYQGDALRKLELPIDIEDWLRSNQEEIHSTGWKRLYGTPYETDVIVYGRGQHVGLCEVADAFLWQMRSSASVTTSNAVYSLQRTNDTLLVPRGTRYTINASDSSFTMVVTMDPSNKPRTKSQ
uniref:3-hydroxyanthranilate 3,4-dioxygenase n=1 Tax=Strigamia maritima TaxID=126957 RepID=T1J601_STRMM